MTVADGVGISAERRETSRKGKWTLSALEIRVADNGYTLQVHERPTTRQGLDAYRPPEELVFETVDALVAEITSRLGATS
jgi:hypothetical protein